MTKQTFVKLATAGNAIAWVLPHNIEKIEKALAKVKPPKFGQAFTDQRDKKRAFPVYKSGMSTGEYVSLYNAANRGLKLTETIDANAYPHPAAEYDATIPLCVQDENPDFDPAEVPAPKAKAPRISKQAARVAELEAAIKLCLVALNNQPRFSVPLDAFADSYELADKLEKTLNK